MRVLLSGNEAVARGCYEHGVKVAVAYPGTPSTEILENVVKYKDDIYCQWSPNEKVAFEVAMGNPLGLNPPAPEQRITLFALKI